MQIGSSFYDYVTVEGEIKTIVPCSLMNCQRITARYNYIVEMIRDFLENSEQEDKGTFEFIKLYENNQIFSYSCNEILRLCGIDVEDCSLEMIEQFLFPSELSERGVLIEFNFPEDEKKSSKTKVHDNTTLATLIAAFSLDNDGDFTKGLEVLERFTSSDLNEILKAKSWLLKSDDEKKREAGFEDALEIMKKRNANLNLQHD